MSQSRLPPAFVDELELLVRARHPLVWVVTHEEERADRALAEVARRTGLEVVNWSATKGLDRKELSRDLRAAADGASRHAGAVAKRALTGEAGASGASRRGVGPLVEALRRLDPDEPRLFVLRDPHPWLREPIAVRALRETAARLRRTRSSLVLLGPVLELPVELEKLATVVDLPLPDRDELAALLDEMLRSVAGRVRVGGGTDLRERAVNAVRGLTEAEAESAFAKALVRDGIFDEQDLPSLMEEKAQVLRKGGLLDYQEPDASMTALGGLELLKAWLAERSRTFSESARAFGLPEPRGLLLLGVQGCGKSLTAKCVAAEWGLPLLRFDLGRLFGSYVGQSEANLRAAIRTAESLAPVVLWIDELEKGLAGARGGGDTGVSMRLLGSLLTWMQEKSAAVFVVATANAISELPPELLRKGRFDEIFFVDLPAAAERREILRIHLARRRRRPEDFDLERLLVATEGWSGAELEECVIAGLHAAYARGSELTDADLLGAAADAVPLSRTMSEQIEGLRRWASGRARPASR